MRSMNSKFLWVALLLLVSCNGSVGVGDAPRPSGLSALDPEVAGLIQQTLAEIEKRPTDPLLRTRLGMVYQANELFDDALTVYQQGLELDSTQPAAWYHVARLQHRLGDVATGIESIGRSITLQPDYVPNFWRRGGWHFESGALEAAEADYRQALTLEQTWNGDLQHLENGRAQVHQGRRGGYPFCGEFRRANDQRHVEQFLI